jgi:hypothetical protein
MTRAQCSTPLQARLIAALMIIFSLAVCTCKQSPPPAASAPKPAAPSAPPAAVVPPATADSIAEVLTTFISAMQEGNEKKAKSVLALEYFENYSLPYAVEIKQWTITDRTVLDTAMVVQLGFVDPAHVGDVRVHTEQYMTGGVEVLGTYWLRKINGYWKIYGWGLS